MNILRQLRDYFPLLLLAAIVSAGVTAEIARGQEGPIPGLGFEPGQGFDNLLKKKFWVIRTRPAEGEDAAPPPTEAPTETLTNSQGMSHAEYVRDLETRGILFAAGPYYDADGNIDGGMLVIRAGSKEEAAAIADADPAHSSGMRTYTLHQWMVNEGQVRVKINFSTGEYEFD